MISKINGEDKMRVGIKRSYVARFVENPVRFMRSKSYTVRFKR